MAIFLGMVNILLLGALTQVAQIALTKALQQDKLLMQQC